MSKRDKLEIVSSIIKTKSLVYIAYTKSSILPTSQVDQAKRLNSLDSLTLISLVICGQ